MSLTRSAAACTTGDGLGEAAADRQSVCANALLSIILNVSDSIFDTTRFGHRLCSAVSRPMNLVGVSRAVLHFVLPRGFE